MHRNAVMHEEHKLKQHLDDMEEHKEEEKKSKKGAGFLNKVRKEAFLDDGNVGTLAENIKQRSLLK